MRAKLTAGQGVPVVVVSMVVLGIGSSLGFLPGYFVAAVRDDLGISRAQVGLLVSLHFGCTGLGSIICARITERIGTRAAVVADQVIVAGAAWGAAILDSYAALLVASVLAGFAYALANAATNEVVAAAVPETRRTLALSAKTSGIPLAALIGAVLVPWASDRWGWNIVLMVAGTAAVAGALIASAVIPDRRSVRLRPQAGEPVPARSGGGRFWSPASRLRSRAGEPVLPRGFWWFAVSAFFLVGSSQPLYSWAVPYLDEGLGGSKPVAGAIAGAASGVGAICMSLSALRADRIGRRRRVPLIVGLCLVLTGAILVVMSGLRLGLAVASAGLFAGLIVQLAAIGTMHAAVVDRAPHAVARATGVTMTGYYLGALATPVSFGALVDWLSTYTWAWLFMALGSVAAAACFFRANQVGDL
ncbi:MFS transporter [Candidatus Poriferisocius sp.]|uniref:MFS transporter n=1 Tax=Candidatus Poriferisocius sp. TaxID=3101276 RepID=UPI003B0283B8